MPGFRQTKGVAEERSESRSFRIIPLICASFTIALGLLTFIGWISGLPLLASVRAKYIPMAPSTAFCFSLIGIGLIVHLLRAALRWLPRAFASLVLAMACAKLVEVFGGFHFGIDAWFVRNPELFGAVPTGRMAPMTALNFVFIATGLLTLTGRQPSKVCRPSRRTRHRYWRGCSCWLLVRNAIALWRPYHSSRVFHRPAVFFYRESAS
jgi:hypothetical protein